MKYKRVDTANGRIMYFADGDMTSKKNIPSDVLRRLESEPEIELEDTILSRPIEVRQSSINIDQCLVCNAATTHQKFLHETTLGVCDEHYQLSTGKIAQLMREKLTEGAHD